MESVQCVRNEEISVQLSVEEKASVDEIVKQAEFSLESQERLDQSRQLLGGALKNQTTGPLTLKRKIYVGHMIKNFPNPLQGTGTFSMSGMSGIGIMAGLMYSGKNIAGVECAWILAFAATKLGKGIYVICGKFNNVDWAHVEHKLNTETGTGIVKHKMNNAGEEVAVYHDVETGTSVMATIVGSNGKYAVGARFCG